MFFLIWPKKIICSSPSCPNRFLANPGNGWHVHQYILDNEKNVFLKKGNYANLSEIGACTICPVSCFIPVLCALWSNPSTNSYKRLVRGFEAPVSAIFATSNRNAAIRIPAYVDEKRNAASNIARGRRRPIPISFYRPWCCPVLTGS